MTATVEEAILDEALDFDYEPPCECLDEPWECGKPAQLICATKCCAFKVLLNEECFFGYYDYCKHPPVYAASIHCKICDFRFPTDEFPLTVLGRL